MGTAALQGAGVCQKGDWQHHSSLNGSSSWLPVQFLLTSSIFNVGEVCEVWHPSLRKLLIPAAEHSVEQIT